MREAGQLLLPEPPRRTQPSPDFHRVERRSHAITSAISYQL
jgi:hypothetical protein